MLFNWFLFSLWWFSHSFLLLIQQMQVLAKSEWFVKGHTNQGHPFLDTQRLKSTRQHCQKRTHHVYVHPPMVHSNRFAETAANCGGDPLWRMQHTCTHKSIRTQIVLPCSLLPPPLCFFLHAALIGNRSCLSGLQTRQCVIPSIPPSLPFLLGVQRSDSPSDKTAAPYEQQAGVKSLLELPLAGGNMQH